MTAPTPEQVKEAGEYFESCIRRNRYPDLAKHAATVLAALKEARKDSARMDWLEREGQGSALVSDDHSRWSVPTTGMQNVPESYPADIQTTFFIEADEWSESVRAAVDAAIADPDVADREVL